MFLQYVYSKTFEIVFFFNVKNKNIQNVHVYIILDFPVTYRNAAMLCQSEMHMFTGNSKHGSLLCKKKRKYLPKRESIHAKCTELSLKRRGNNLATVNVCRLCQTVYSLCVSFVIFCMFFSISFSYSL